MPNPSGSEIINSVLPVIYLVDVSIEIDDNIISEMEEILTKYIELLNSKIKQDKGLRIKIAVLSYSNKVSDLTFGYVDLEDFCLPKLRTSGVSCLGNAVEYLIDNYLDSDVFLEKISFACYPIIHFLVGSKPHDDYRKILDRANTTRFFKQGIRIATCFGTDCDLDSLEIITGTKESVIKKEDINTCNLLYDNIYRCERSDLFIAEEIEYEYCTQEGDRRIIDGVIKIYLCQVIPCSPENAMNILFEMKTIDKWYGFEKRNLFL